MAVSGQVSSEILKLGPNLINALDGPSNREAQQSTLRWYNAHGRGLCLTVGLSKCLPRHQEGNCKFRQPVGPPRLPCRCLDHPLLFAPVTNDASIRIELVYPLYLGWACELVDVEAAF
jgi:hypothetical protein